MLHYIIAQMYRQIYDEKKESEKRDKEYAFGTIAKILCTLHYLSCIWIYVGGADFMDSEEGHLPWQYANIDFIGMNNYQIYVFSTYWVFTVITTVGYGDYTPGTTNEYIFVLFLELIGIAVFSVLQISVTRVLRKGYNFDAYLNEKET